MEWKLFEECKGHSWECDIHELKDLGGGRGFLFISRGCGGREGIERFVKNVPRNSHYPPRQRSKRPSFAYPLFPTTNRDETSSRESGSSIWKSSNFLPSFLHLPLPLNSLAVFLNSRVSRETFSVHSEEAFSKTRRLQLWRDRV